MFDELTPDQQTILRKKILRGVNKTAKLTTFTLSIQAGINPLYEMASGTMRELCELHTDLCNA